MERITENAKASVEFCVEWESREAKHTDCFFTENVNLWRDCFSPELHALFMGKQAGETIELFNKSEAPAGKHEARKVCSIIPSRFNTRYLPDREITPRPGRFYPQGIIKGVPGIFRVNNNLCRCIKVSKHGLDIDLNHPLAGYPLTVTASIHEIRNNTTERGGRCEDWIETITANGPGLQARYSNLKTDFSNKFGFSRDDESADRKFYSNQRMVHHLDSRARAIIHAIHHKYLQVKSRILDLMGSWESHLPGSVNFNKLTVLGLNKDELAANRKATERIIHDLNANPLLPFPEHSFDGVICTVSVEYLIRPYEVFSEISRILSPGGVCVMTFSNRWFPPKVVRIWQDLHEFERVGLVSDYFLQTETFEGLQTLSCRGWPRPEEDKYFGALPYSDPVYAVIAWKG